MDQQPGPGQILEKLASLPDVVVEVSAERVKLYPPRWK
jgi:hypothetical protein